MGWLIIGSVIVSFVWTLKLQLSLDVGASIPTFQRVPAGMQTVIVGDQQSARLVGAVSEWACEVCHETGLGDPERLAFDEVEHALRGCNGSLSIKRIVDRGIPAIPTPPPGRRVRGCG